MIKASNLCKFFKIRKRKSGFFGAVGSLFYGESEEIRAVDNVSFEISEGELVGYIGQNGAGKSTTIKMLTGILKPTSGEIRIGGLDPYSDRKKNAFQIGVVFGQRSQLWMDLPVEESFDLLKSIYEIEDSEYKKKIEFFSDLLGLKDFFRQQARKLSLGQRMKADLAASLLHSPKVLFLDEPTIGLDLLVKERVREFIRSVNSEEKTTIILTTHDIQDIEYLAKRIIIIDNGKIGYDGGIQEFSRLLGNESLLNVHFSMAVKDITVPEPFRLKQVFSDTHCAVTVPEDIPVSELMNYFHRKGWLIHELSREKADLGDAVKKMYAGRKDT